MRTFEKLEIKCLKETSTGNNLETKGDVQESLCKISIGIKVTLLDDTKDNLTCLPNTHEL